MRRINLTILAVAVAATLAPGVARASGFLVARFGGEQGHPTTTHGSAIYFNPAGLALTSGTRIYAEGMFGTRTASYYRPTAAIDNLVPEGDSGGGTPGVVSSANSGTATLSNPFAAPFAAVVSDLGVRNLGVGIGVYVPFGGAASWDSNSEYTGNDMYPGAVDGVQRWWSIEGSIQSIYTTAAVSYYLPEARLALGAGLNVIRTEVRTIRARNAIGTDDLVASDGSPQEGRALLDAHNMTMSVGIGAIWQPVDALFVGVSYQSRPNFKTTNLKGKLTTKLGLSAPSETDVALRWPLPDVFRAGVTIRPVPRLELRVFGDYVRWSVVDDHCTMTMSTMSRGCKIDDQGNAMSDGATVVVNIPRRWKDAMGVRMGASYWLSSAREIFAGLGYDGSAIPDETLGPDIIDQDKMTASVGTRIEVARHMRLAGTFTQVFYFKRQLAARDEPTFEGISRTPDQAGTYKQSVSVFNLGLEYLF